MKASPGGGAAREPIVTIGVPDWHPLSLCALERVIVALTITGVLEKIDLVLRQR